MFGRLAARAIPLQLCEYHIFSRCERAFHGSVRQRRGGGALSLNIVEFIECREKLQARLKVENVEGAAPAEGFRDTFYIHAGAPQENF